MRSKRSRSSRTVDRREIERIIRFKSLPYGSHAEDSLRKALWFLKVTKGPLSAVQQNQKDRR
jgi:hypothetical protein